MLLPKWDSLKPSLFRNDQLTDCRSVEYSQRNIKISQFFALDDLCTIQNPVESFLPKRQLHALTAFLLVFTTAVCVVLNPRALTFGFICCHILAKCTSATCNMSVACLQRQHMKLTTISNGHLKAKVNY